MSNEQLCIAALGGDTEARNALVENNLRFIKRTAYEMWSAQRELNAALGIEINELPVIAPRCDTPLEPGMVLALEPKFVLDSIGPVGTENTYVMTSDGLERITLCDEAMLCLE